MKNNSDIQNLQKYIIGGFMEYGHAQDYKEVIPSKLFGIYEPLYTYMVEHGNAKLPEFYEVCQQIGTEFIVEAMDRSDISFITQRDKYIEKLLDLHITDIISKEKTPMGILEKVKTIYEKLNHIKLGTNGGITKIDTLLYGLQDEIEEAIGYGDKQEGYKTGIQIIDKYTGGLVKGRTIRLSAYSNIGKSAFSYGVVNSILKQGAKVLYFSLEIPKEDLRNRLLSNYYGIPIQNFSKKSTLKELDLSEYAKFKLYICSDVFTMSDIEKVTATVKPDAIFIDYVQLVKAEGREEYEQMNDVARRIRKLTAEHDCAVFDLSQVSNDSVKYKKGGVIPAKGSGELVSAASIVLVMNESQFPGKVNIHLAKNRHGIKGKCHEFTPDFTVSKFNDEFEITADATSF